MSSKPLRTSSRLLRHPSDESGIALIAVLWVLLLLSTLAATVGYVTRVNAIVTHRALQLAQVEAAADAAIVDTTSTISGQRDSSSSLTTEGARNWQFEGIETTISVTKESGRLDLNKADGSLLSAFLQSQGIAPETAATLVSTLAEANGSSAMAAAETSLSARGGTSKPNSYRLKDVDELRRILTWNSQPIDCWADSFTVYSGLSEISAADAATPAVIGALHWAQAHHTGDRDWVTNAASTSNGFGQASVIGSVLRIVATARAENLTARTLWIGRVTGDQENPVLTMVWDHSSLVTQPCAK